MKAIANANIALIKYWGKRNDRLILPYNSSISATLDKLTATTEVTFSDKYTADKFILNGAEQSGEELERVVETLNVIRKRAGSKKRALVESENNFPTAAGLASSAAGGAALALAGSNAMGLSLDRRELSILARLNSGSACRSVEGGFVKWARGKERDGSDSFGSQIYQPSHWPEFRIIVTVLSNKAKKIKTRAGMKTSVETSPFYTTWSKGAEASCPTMEDAIGKKDIEVLGVLAERNAVTMHCVMMATVPPIIYWLPQTVDVMHAIQNARDDGIKCYYTMDAGPQVKIICLEKDTETILKRLKQIENIEDTIVCGLGGPARLVE